MKKMKKVSQFRKKTESPFGLFQHPFCRKSPETMKAEPLRKFFCLKVVALCQKNEKNGETILPNFFSKFF